MKKKQVSFLCFSQGGKSRLSHNTSTVHKHGSVGSRPLVLTENRSVTVSFDFNMSHFHKAVGDCP